MSSDPVVAILERLERPVQPRAEFGEELLRRLLAELEPPAPAPAARRPRFAALPLRVRVALVVLSILLFVGAAAATYFGVRTWLSSGPRGPQFTSDFQFVEIFRDDSGSFYSDFKLAPDGESLYGLRHPPPHPQRETVLVTLTGLREETAESEEVLNFAELTEPALWDPGVDLAGKILGTALYQSGDDVLAVAENGDVFFVAAAWEEGHEQDPGVPARALSVVVVARGRLAAKGPDAPRARDRRTRRRR